MRIFFDFYKFTPNFFHCFCPSTPSEIPVEHFCNMVTDSVTVKVIAVRNNGQPSPVSERSWKAK